ncbi:MAG: hypothetical protein P1V19_10785 [Gimesia sp.]|nr:hypothetical protein [Gimesia sp.]
MNHPSYESEIQDHYANFQLKEELVDQILDAGQFAASARRWKQIAIAASIGLAAMIVLTIGLLFRGSSENQPIAKSTNSVEPKTKPERKITAPVIDQCRNTNQQATEKKQTTLPAQYRLVAFRSHSDACPHCRATGIVYHELEESLDKTPLAFMEFDLSNNELREKTDQSIRQLQLEPLVEGRSETAFIALTDLNGKPIQEFKPSMGSKKIAEQVRKLIHR